MDFIKRHYEKVILLGLFLIFIGLMFLVQSVISSTHEVKESDLKLPKFVADHEPANPDSDEFKTQKRWEDSHLEWAENMSRNHEKGMSDFSDFVVTFPMAICPHCVEKSANKDFKILVPRSNFSVQEKGKVIKKSFCPQCKSELLAPPEKSAAEENATEEDLDGDGIPNEVEKQFGMDPNNPDDARYDSDGDGFSNVFEITQGIAPNDAVKHPPAWWRLHIKDIRQVELPVKFMALNDNASDDKNMWQLQFNHPDYRRKGRTASSFRRIGQTIDIEGRKYKITDVERRVTQRQRQAGSLDNKEGMITEKIDTSRVFLTEIVRGNVDPDKLTMTVNRPAYSSDKRPVLIDSGDVSDKKKEYVLKIGDKITLGLFNVADSMDMMTGRRNQNRVKFVYRLKEVDAENMVLKMEDITLAGRRNPKNKNEKIEFPIVEITRKGQVPVNMFPVKKKERIEQEFSDDPMLR